MRDVRKDFPVVNHHIYLDNASVGPMSESLMEWRNEHDIDYLIGASMFRQTHKDFIEKVRKKTAQFFDAETENVALIPNFSLGFNALLEGIPKTARILLLNNDYPSVTWAVQYRGFKTHTVEIDEHLEENILEAIENHRPDFFIFSIVQYLNGIKIDLDFIKNLKKQYPDMILIGDGTQYFGTERFSFRESGIDIILASGYKWLLAGFGNGFLAVNETVKKEILPQTMGFNSLEYDEHASPENSKFVRHFEPGHHDTLCFGTLGFSLDYLKNLGLENIENHIKQLADKAKTGLAELGLLEESVVKRKQHSNIFNIRGDEKLHQFLRTNNIISTPRGKGIRVGFHFYNTEKEIGSLLALLKKR